MAASARSKTKLGKNYLFHPIWRKFVYKLNVGSSAKNPPWETHFGTFTVSFTPNLARDRFLAVWCTNDNCKPLLECKTIRQSNHTSFITSDIVSGFGLECLSCPSQAASITCSTTQQCSAGQVMLLCLSKFGILCTKNANTCHTSILCPGLNVHVHFSPWVKNYTILIKDP